MLEENSHHNYAQWDLRVEQQSNWCHFLQSAEWASVQNQNRWKTRLTELKLATAPYPIVLYKRRVAGWGYIYQVPKLARLPLEAVGEFTSQLKRSAGHGLAIKLDIDELYEDKLHAELLKNGWQRMPSIQYKETVLIDLTKGREELLKSFKKRARTELNAGLRRGVKVEKLAVSAQDMQLVYDLLNQTYKRAGFVTRNRAFTEAYWREFARAGHGSMYVATYEGRPLAAAYVIHIGKRAFYKDGASIRVKPDVFASRVMQWHIIQDMKKRGCEVYDLCGVSTEDGSSIAGVSLFKTGFGDPVKLQWGYELPLAGWHYKVWKTLLERLVSKYSLRIKKELWY
jgi:serine/alanine adding enzyme